LLDTVGADVGGSKVAAAALRDGVLGPASVTATAKADTGARGERDPLRGMTSPSFRRWIPRWTARLRSEGRSLKAITTLTLEGRPLTARLRSWEEDEIRLDLLRGERTVRRLQLLVEDGDYRINFVRRADR
jgi:hypothetical protein